MTTMLKVSDRSDGWLIKSLPMWLLRYRKVAVKGDQTKIHAHQWLKTGHLRLGIRPRQRPGFQENTKVLFVIDKLILMVTRILFILNVFIIDELCCQIND